MNNTTLESTAAHTPTQTDICRAFNAALLLTGSTILAEATVLSAIEALDAHNIRREPLLAEVIRISVRFRTDWCDRRPNRVTHPQPQLPVELQNVLQLPAELRHAFVLRTLLNLSPEVSAGLLRTEPGQVDADLLDALELLTARNEITTMEEWLSPMAAFC